MLSQNLTQSQVGYNVLMHLTRLQENPVQKNFVNNFKQLMAKKLSTTSFTFSMIIILVLGSAFFIGLHYFMNPQQSPLAISSYQPVTSNPVSLTLNLSSPDDNLLIYDPNLLISGQTSSGITVLITVNDTNQIISASTSGDFSLTVKLQTGTNQVIVSAFDNQGNYKIEERSIYYSEEKL